MDPIIDAYKFYLNEILDITGVVPPHTVSIDRPTKFVGTLTNSGLILTVDMSSNGLLHFEFEDPVTGFKSTKKHNYTYLDEVFELLMDVLDRNRFVPTKIMYYVSTEDDDTCNLINCHWDVANALSTIGYDNPEIFDKIMNGHVLYMGQYRHAIAALNANKIPITWKDAVIISSKRGRIYEKTFRKIYGSMIKRVVNTAEKVEIFLI